MKCNPYIYLCFIFLTIKSAELKLSYPNCICRNPSQANNSVFPPSGVSKWSGEWRDI